METASYNRLRVIGMQAAMLSIFGGIAPQLVPYSRSRGLGPVCDPNTLGKCRAKKNAEKARKKAQRKIRKRKMGH